MSLNTQQPSQLPPEAAAVLNRLRTRIRQYVFLEGLALVVALLGGLFWGSFLIDWCYFYWSRLELPRWFRAAVLILGLSLLCFGLVAWVALRLLRSMRTKALALVLERRFPELDDRLITAVEAASDPNANHSPITAAMLKRTIADAAQSVGRLDLGSVFDKKPIRRAVITASVLVASILGLAVTNSAAMERWFAGYISLRDGYWPRETDLIVRVLVQPGDRVRDFIDGGYKHAKGTDLTLQIEVPAGKKTPEQVRLDVELADGRGIRVLLTRIGDEPFRHTLPGLLDDAQLWVTGGDYTSPRPYRVIVVQPPEVRGIVLHCLFPEYTGMNERTGEQISRTRQEVNGAQTSLPMATDFVMEAASNKPLKRVRIEGDAGQERWEIVLNAPSAGNSEPLATIILKSQDARPEVKIAWPEAMSQAIWSTNLETVALPFVLAPDGARKLPEILLATNDSKNPLTFPLPLPPDSAMRIILEDADGITSTTPAKFTINGIVDQPPVVEMTLRGIGSSITRKARIPVLGTLRDDYGVVSARFDYRVDDGQGWLPRDLQSPPRGSLREFILQRSDAEPFERFDVAPLDLSVGQRLTMTVSALDGCTVPDPPRSIISAKTTSEEKVEPISGSANPDAPAHRSQSSKKNVFTIVTEEELLSMLYAREINVRKRFEQIITELKQSRTDLMQQREKADEAARLKKEGATSDSDPLVALSLGLTACSDRSLHSIRKNAVETYGVQTSFEDIREELINNAADTPLMLQRLGEQIIGPLHTICETDFPAIDSSLGLFKLALEKNTDPTGPMITAAEGLDSMIRKMELILSEMRELAKFHEVVEQLKANIKAQQDLLEETKRKRKENAIKSLE